LHETEARKQVGHFDRSLHHPTPIRRQPMTTTSYAADRTALLVVDPYNDFMSEEGGRVIHFPC
jgi:hypothetical protein